MTRTPYHYLAIVSAWALASITVAFAVLAAPESLPGRAIIWWLFPILYAVCAFAAYLLADLLEDFQSQRDLREKFAVFLVHIFLLTGHIPLLRGFWIIWSIAFVMIPFVLFLQREINFNRLALACGILWIARLIRVPAEPPLWTLLFASLVLLTLISSRYFTIYRRYGVEHGEAPRHFWLTAGIWIASISLIAGAASFLLPTLTPVRFTPPASQHGISDPGALPPIDTPFLIEVLFWTALVIGILYLIYFIRSKFHGKGQTPFEIARSTIQRVKEELDRKVVQPWRANLMNPADRVIFHYNQFCESMARFNLPRRHSMTPAEYSAFLHDHSRSGHVRRDDLQFISELFQKALYGAEVITSIDSRHFHRIAQEIIRDHEQSATDHPHDDASG